MAWDHICSLLEKIPFAILMGWICFFILQKLKRFRETSMKKVFMRSQVILFLIGLIGIILGLIAENVAAIETSIVCSLLALLQYLYLRVEKKPKRSNSLPKREIRLIKIGEAAIKELIVEYVMEKDDSLFDLSSEDEDTLYSVVFDTSERTMTLIAHY